MPATGLSTDPTEYRARLSEQPDEQLDAWAQELLRDMVIRRGLPRVVADFRDSVGLDEPGLERVFASGGGAPATTGRDAEGRLLVPTVSLWALVPGLRAQAPDARARIIDYLVANFHDFVYT